MSGTELLIKAQCWAKLGFVLGSAAGSQSWDTKGVEFVRGPQDR